MSGEDGSGACARTGWLVDRTAELLRDPAPSAPAVDALLEELAALSPRLLMQLERRCWFRLNGHGRLTTVPTASLGARLSARVGGALRRSTADPLPSADGARLRAVAGLLSRDGYEREWAVAAAPDGPLVSRLLAIRTADWVEPVREAAVARFERASDATVLDALPVAVRLASAYKRGGLLLPLLMDKLGETDLRSLFASDDALVRRAVWRRIIEAGTVVADDLVQIAGRDPDPVVRLTASRTADGLPPSQRRAVATHFAADAVGYVAAASFRTLVELDGAAAIEPALTSRSATLRRSARGFAALYELDARAVVIRRLAAGPVERTALLALAELADPRDRDRFEEMLGDPRVSIVAAGLRALAQVDEQAARRTALTCLQTQAAGSVARVAADVLRRGRPNEVEAVAIERIALDRGRTTVDRVRALELLRGRRWQYLAVALDAYAAETVETDSDEALDHILLATIRRWSSATITRGPDVRLRARIAARLDLLDETQRLQIDFILRTAK